MEAATNELKVFYPFVERDAIPVKRSPKHTAWLSTPLIC